MSVTRPARGRLGIRGRRAILVVHILSAGTWIGVDVLVAVLVLTGWFADDLAVRGLAYQALASFVVWPMLIAGLVSLTSGLLLGLGTRWGVLRYWWVVVKLALNLVLCTLIVVALRPGMPEVGSYGASLAAGGQPSQDVSFLFFPPAVSLSALTLATVLAVFKPWGRLKTRGAREVSPREVDPGPGGTGGCPPGSRPRPGGDGGCPPGSQHRPGLRRREPPAQERVPPAVGQQRPRGDQDPSRRGHGVASPRLRHRDRPLDHPGDLLRRPAEPGHRTGLVRLDGGGGHRGVEPGVRPVVGRPGSSAAAVSPKAVVIRPGSITITSTPNGRTSNRSASDSASTAYLLAWYAPPPGQVSRPPIEERLTILPQPWARIPGSTSWHIRSSPKTLVSNCRRTASSDSVSSAPDWL